MCASFDPRTHFSVHDSQAVEYALRMDVDMQIKAELADDKSLIRGDMNGNGKDRERHGDRDRRDRDRSRDRRDRERSRDRDRR